MLIDIPGFLRRQILTESKNRFALMAVHPPLAQWRHQWVASGHQGVVRKIKEFRSGDRQCISALDVGAVASESTEGLADDCRFKVGGAGTRSGAFAIGEQNRGPPVPLIAAAADILGQG